MKSCFWILYILSRFSYDLSSCLKYIWSYISKDENTILLLITSIWWTNCCCYHHHHFVKQKKIIIIIHIPLDFLVNTDQYVTIVPNTIIQNCTKTQCATRVLLNISNSRTVGMKNICEIKKHSLHVTYTLNIYCYIIYLI